MATARINGYLVFVTRVVDADTTTYTISGPDAAGLHDVLVTLKAAATELQEGAFSVSKARLTDAFMDMPYLIGLERQLAKATKDQLPSTTRPAAPVQALPASPQPK